MLSLTLYILKYEFIVQYQSGEVPERPLRHVLSRIALPGGSYKDGFHTHGHPICCAMNPIVMKCKLIIIL